MSGAARTEQLGDGIDCVSPGLGMHGICTSVAIPILNLHYLDDKTLVEKVMIFFAV